MTLDEIQALINRHGGLVSAPVATQPTIKDTNPESETYNLDIPNPNPTYRYIMRDGTTFEARSPDNGQTFQITDPGSGLRPSSAAEGWTNITPVNNGGTITYYGKNPSTGRFEKVPGMPTASPDSRTPPSDPSKWVPIRANPQDPNSRVIALQDPTTGDRVAVPQDAGDRNTAQGATKQTIESGRVITWVADGQGNWSIQTMGQPMQPAGTPKEGDTRQNVSGGYEVREVYRGGSWVTDPSFQPRPYSPDAASKPKEGDRRENVQSGYAVSEVYRGGAWVIDPSVPPKPYTPQAPTTLNTGTGPYIVQQDPRTGQITQIPNPNTTDVASRVQQLQGTAQSKRDELQRRYETGAITEQQRDAEWAQWWSENIEPHRQSLQQTQETATAAATRQAQQDQRSSIADEANYEQNRRTFARQAGTEAVERVKTTLPYRVGATFAGEFAKGLETLSSGGGAVNFSPSSFMFDMPDLDKVAEQATARALAGISPYAALKAGAPMPQIPQGVDLNTALSSSRYQFGGAPPASTGTKVTLPDGTVIEPGSSQGAGVGATGAAGLQPPPQAMQRAPEPHERSVFFGGR